MTVKGRLRRQRGETERHYLARKIFLPYLEVKEQELKRSKIDFEFPPYGGRARADIALITEKPPIAMVEIWVEIQDTKLSKTSWRKKLSTIADTFKPRNLYLAITENLSPDLLSILDIVSDALDKFEFFLIDTKKKLIYSFAWKDGIEVYKINVKNNKIVRKRLEITLDRFLG